jgi:hypothetical protein
MLKWASRVAIIVGSVLLIISAAFYLVLDRAGSAEQALSPGEKSFGVAVLGMIYGPPIVVTSAIGILSLFLGVVGTTVHRFHNPE